MVTILNADGCKRPNNNQKLQGKGKQQPLKSLMTG
jgi:hypothetical protein